MWVAIVTALGCGGGGGTSTDGSTGGAESTSDTASTTLTTDTSASEASASSSSTTSAETSTTGADSSGTTMAASESSGSSGAGSSSSSSGDTEGCVPTEDVEATCDNLDNDCNGYVDDIDVGGDGICDCLSIGILGATGYAPTSNFEAWLTANGTSVTRTLLQNQPGVVTDELLADYDLVIIDRIERGLDDAEAQAIEDFVKVDGHGMVTLIGYNFDNNNPVPEVDRANTVVAPFGLAYQGGYLHDDFGVTPTFDQGHPIGMGLLDVNYIGGVAPADLEDQGTSAIFATVPMGDAGIAHETATGGRVVMWGDEWVTFDSDWVGFADVELFWTNVLAWARPQEFCALPPS